MDVECRISDRALVREGRALRENLEPAIRDAPTGRLGLPDTAVDQQVGAAVPVEIGTPDCGGGAIHGNERIARLGVHELVRKNLGVAAEAARAIESLINR